MNRTWFVVIVAAALLVPTLAFAATPQYPIHWMPDYAAAKCQVPVNAFSTKMVNGIIGHRSDGSEICFIPHKGGGAPSSGGDAAPSSGGSSGSGSSCSDVTTCADPVCSTHTVCLPPECSPRWVCYGSGIHRHCSNQWICAPPVCHDETSCADPVCHTTCV